MARSVIDVPDLTKEELDQLMDTAEDIIARPDDYAELVIEGGNHAQFGDYGAQDGDGTPTITNEEQITRTADAIADLAASK